MSLQQTEVLVKYRLGIELGSDALRMASDVANTIPIASDTDFKPRRDGRAGTVDCHQR